MSRTQKIIEYSLAALVVAGFTWFALRKATDAVTGAIGVFWLKLDIAQFPGAEALTIIDVIAAVLFILLSITIVVIYIKRALIVKIIIYTYLALCFIWFTSAPLIIYLAGVPEVVFEQGYYEDLSHLYPLGFIGLFYVYFHLSSWFSINNAYNKSLHTDLGQKRPRR